MHKPVNKVMNLRQGMTIGALGGFALSFDIPLIRAADGNLWSVAIVRCGSVALACFMMMAVLRLVKGKWPKFDMSGPGLITTFFYAFSTVVFIGASFHTSTANLVFILAFSPAISAFLGWILMKEVPPKQTMLAIIFLIIGVGIIVQDSFAAGKYLGDGLAMLTAISLSLAIVFTGKYDLDMRFNVLAANGVPAIIGLFIMATGGSFVLENPSWSLFNGFIVIPISFLCLAYAPRLLPGPVAAMFFMIETILAPIWVWIAFQEIPTDATLIGGALMLATLFVHSCWQAGFFSKAKRPAPH